MANPEDANMKPPKGFFPFWRPFSPEIKPKES
jgi:hypothetical protein